MAKIVRQLRDSEQTLYRWKKKYAVQIDELHIGLTLIRDASGHLSHEAVERLQYDANGFGQTMVLGKKDPRIQSQLL